MGKENLKRSENKTLVHFLTNKCIHLKSHPFAKGEPVLSDLLEMANQFGQA